MGVVFSKHDFMIMELFNNFRRCKIIYWIQIWNQILKQMFRSWDLHKLSYVGQENSRRECLRFDYCSSSGTKFDSDGLTAANRATKSHFRGWNSLQNLRPLYLIKDLSSNMSGRHHCSAIGALCPLRKHQRFCWYQIWFYSFYSSRKRHELIEWEIEQRVPQCI